MLPVYKVTGMKPVGISSHSTVSSRENLSVIDFYKHILFKYGGKENGKDFLSGGL